MYESYFWKFKNFGGEEYKQYAGLPDPPARK